MLIDSHCHLNHLKDITIDNAVERATAAGVTHMLSICVENKDILDLEHIVATHLNVKSTLGIHPCDVSSHSKEDFEAMIQLMKEKPKQFIGLGETGLDFYYSKEFAAKQEDFFAQHLIQANQLDCPVVVHSRNAEDETIDILKANPHNKVIIHCFSGTLTMAKRCLDLGAYISFSGIITFKNANALREIVEYVPLERMLVETDSPYLAPVPHRGHENQPAYVKEVAQAVAELKKTSFDTVAAQTTRNFSQLFGWPAVD